MKEKEQNYEIGDIVCPSDEKKKFKISMVTGVKREVLSNGLISYTYQLDEGESWTPSGFIKPFVDEKMLEKIIEWLRSNLGGYGYVFDKQLVELNRISVFDALKAKMFLNGGKKSDAK